MEKITLADKEYELPEITFGVIRKLGKLGFTLTDFTNIEENFADYIAACVAFITNSTLEEADEIIDNSFTTAEEFGGLTNTLVQWMVESDFFKKMQAEKKKTTQTRRSK